MYPEQPQGALSTGGQTVNPMQEAETIKVILKSAQDVLEMLGDDHPLSESIGDDLEDLIARIGGPFPTGEDES